MATLNIRNLPDEVHRRLRIRAAEHGRSMEAEARAILSEACAGRPASASREAEAAIQRLQTHVRRLYTGRDPGGVVDEFIADRKRDWDPE